MKTLSTQYMELAANRVSQVQKQDWSEKAKTQYGGLCHSFPVMVRQCGLAQAVAFSLAKADKPAHQRIVDDVSKVIEVDARTVHAMNLVDYMTASRRILSAWIFYKRFAESILKVKSGEGEDDTP